MWVAIVVVLGLAVLQLLPVVMARRARGRQVPELEAFLSPAQRRAERLLVYFWSPTCAVCRPMSKALDEVGSEAIVRVNVLEAAPLVTAFNVLGTPSLAVVEGGVIKDLQVGARSAAQVRALLQSST